jgi:hypothetical protein
VPPLATDNVPVVPATIGRPVQLVKVPEVGVPSRGVTNVGDVANTSEPEPVSSVTAAAKFELEGVAKNVATPVPKPLTPVEIGNPVQLVNVPEDGVPKAGVTSVGDVESTTFPVPVEVVTPVPPLATDKVPVVPATIGKPVQLVNVPEVGVPRTGVTKVGDVANTKAPDPVSSVTAAAICADVAWSVLLVRLIVLLVSVSVVALPTNVSVEVGNVRVPVLTIELITGVVSVGDVPNTNAPEPVSPVTAAAKLALVGVAKNVATPVPNPLTPEEIGSPVQLVNVPEAGVPSTGVTNVGESR